jgi:hypothetical protein
MSAPVRLADIPPAGRRIVAALIEAERAARTHEPTPDPSGRTGAALNEKVTGSAARPAATRSAVVRPGRLRPLPAGAGSAVR